MLQFATDDSSRHPVGKQVEIALQAGCRWIRVTGTPADEIVEGLIPPCQDNDAILVLDNNIELVDKLRIHGLHLTEWTRGSLIGGPREARPACHHRSFMCRFRAIERTVRAGCGLCRDPSSRQ